MGVISRRQIESLGDVLGTLEGDILGTSWRPIFADWEYIYYDHDHQQFYFQFHYSLCYSQFF